MEEIKRYNTRKDRTTLSERMNMMFEERAAKILEVVDSRTTVNIADLAEIVGTSESTIRRDITELDQMGKLKRVRGGATRKSNPVITGEYDVQLKSGIHADLKSQIAKYAATTIHSDDLVYIDAGTTTLMMIPFIHAPGAVFVTNGFSHAKALTQKGYVVYITGGRFKLTTEAMVGYDAVRSIEKYNFTKCYMGTNGIDEKRGFTTPDVDEALIKEAAMEHAYISYVLADSSKFRKVSSVTFSKISDACIITDSVPDEHYKKLTVIKSVK